MDSTYNQNGGHMPLTRRIADLDGPDFYPTPRWATFALVDNEPFAGNIWECACGDGAMSKVLEETGNRIRSTDLYDRGYGDVGHDFLTTRRRCANIVTNPPYHSAEGFVAIALKRADEKVAFLLRLAFLESARRSRTIFLPHPPTRVWVFSERITFYARGVKTAGSGTTPYAWFIWDKNRGGSTETKWFEPGYKARYG